MKQGVIPICVFLCILAISSGCSTVQPYEYTAENITHQFIQHQNQVKDYSASFVKILQSPNISLPYEIGQIVVKRPFMYRIVVREGSNDLKNGTIFFRNQSYVSQYETLGSWYYILPLDEPQDSPLDDYDLQTEIVMIMQESPFIYDGIVRIGDRKAFVLEVNLSNLSRISPAFSHIKVWIDTDTWMVLKTETYKGSRDQTIVTEYSDIKVNTGVPDSIFNFVPPMGARQFYVIPPGFFDEMREVPTSTPPGGIPLPMPTPEHS
jgi:outer membrane lipoprotein-sorting protein